MPTERTEDPAGSPIPEANYFEHAPELNVGSWSPTPAGQEHPREKPTQVHLRFGTPPGPCSLVRLKSARVIDLLIDGLLEHREYVWGKRTGAYQAVLDKVRNDALEEAAEIARGFGPSRPLVRVAGAPPPARIEGRWEGEQAASGGIAHLIRELKGRKPPATPIIPSLEPR